MVFGRRFRSAVAAVLGAVLAVGSHALPANADTNVTLPFKVNFQAQTSTTPSGYNGDYGKAYDAVRGWGWVDSSGNPLSLVGNGRQRNVAADKRLDTLMQMQLLPGSSGVTTPGAWRAAVPNGTYSVTVAAGDPSYTNSHNVIRVEGTTAIDFTPTGSSTSEVNTVTVTVNDGFIDVDAVGGTNTKIDYLEIASTSAVTPYVSAVTPNNGTTGVNIDAAVTVQLSEGVDATTVNANSYRLYDPSHALIAAHYNTDGAYSNATLVPDANLAANTTYTVEVTNAMKDPKGNAYTPFTSSFTTGSSTGTQQANVTFTKNTFDGTNTDAPTALAIGPDGKLYAAFGSGVIRAYTLDANGKKTGTPTDITTFQTSVRVVTGLAFDPASTASNLALWVSHAQGNCDLAAMGKACDDFSGGISKLSGSSSSNLVRTDVVTGLPRSVGNHMNNGIAFGPDGALYLAQGANNGYGAADAIWGNRQEDPLTAAVLRMDVKNISGTLSVDTSKGYNPNASGALVKTYATGIRNPFSLLWHSNGKLYAPVNESSNGNTLATPSGYSPTAPALTNLPAYNDYFTQVVPGKYYGHPNNTRNEYILNGANPTAGKDAFEVAEYPVGTQPNSNYRAPDMDLGLHRSADGSVEYKSSAFSSALKGQVLVTEYANGKDVIAIKFDASGKPVSKAVVAKGFNNPLAITADPVSGRVYVGEYGEDPTGAGGQITMLTPQDSTTQPPAGSIFHVNFQTSTTTTPTDYVGDYGLPFDATRGYGWENTAGAATDFTANGRERGVNTADSRLDTFLQMQATTGQTAEGRWELVVPNGTYDVTIGVGDPSYTNSHDVINAEGTKVVDFTPSAGMTNNVVTSTINVTDGRLTLDAAGGTNTKIDYVDLTPHSTGPVTGTQVAAVNFQAQTTATPSGYSGDYGKAYDATRGFGWEDASSGAPLSLVGNGRERNVASDKRLDTLMQMQLPAGSAGVTTPGRWELAVANGTYDVTVAVGDPSYTNSHHVINAEGAKIVDFTPATGTTSQTVTAKVSVTDGLLTLDATGGTNTKLDYVVVTTSDGTTPTPDTTPPTVDVVVSGTQDGSGNYVGSGTVTINASDVGGTVKNVTYTLDGGPSQAYSAPFTVSTVGSHTVVAQAQDNSNNTSGLVTKTFNVVTGSGGTATPTSLAVASPEDSLGLGSRMVFSTVKDAARPGHAFTIKNNGTGTLNVTGLTIGGTNAADFKLADGTGTVFSLAPGATKDITVNYRPAAGSASGKANSWISSGTLTVTSNDATAPQYVVTLGGMDSPNYEGDTEPNLQEIAKALGYTVNIGVTPNKPRKQSISVASAAAGDEVISAYWQRADTSKPASLTPVAHYSGKDLQGNDSTQFGWYAKGSGTNNYLYAFLGANNGNQATEGANKNDGYGENQLLLPKTTKTPYTFSPSGAFGFVDAQGNKSDDNLNANGKWHNVRFYPVKDANGVVIPGSYLVGDDIGAPQGNGAKNWDYQDYVFLLTNVKPFTPDVQPTPTGLLAKALDFNGTDGGTANSGFTVANGSVDTSKLSVSNGKLSVTTSNDSNTSHTNALSLPLNSGSNFNVKARLVGPFDAINAGQEQQAIFFGPDATHYLKAEVEWNASQGKRMLTIYKQDGTSGGTNGAGGHLVTTIPLPGGNANTIDLRIEVTPSSYPYKDATGATVTVTPPYADVYYAIDGGAETRISLASAPAAEVTTVRYTTGAYETDSNGNKVVHVALPNSFITANGMAGIITSNQGGGSPFTATYENFSISRRY